MELVDVLDSKSGEVKLVWVQAPLPVLQSDDFDTIISNMT